MEDEKKTIAVEEINPSQSLNALWTLQNKAASQGVFNIDESYIIKVLFTKISSEMSKKNELVV